MADTSILTYDCLLENVSFFRKPTRSLISRAKKGLFRLFLPFRRSTLSTLQKYKNYKISAPKKKKFLLRSNRKSSKNPPQVQALERQTKKALKTLGFQCFFSCLLRSFSATATQFATQLSKHLLLLTFYKPRSQFYHRTKSY